MTCPHDETSCCPLAFTESSEITQSCGCLPSPYEIMRMRVNHGKTWACHSEPTKPCIGAIKCLKEQGLPHTVIDPTLITEEDDWSAYTR